MRKLLFVVMCSMQEEEDEMGVEGSMEKLWELDER